MDRFKSIIQNLPTTGVQERNIADEIYSIFSVLELSTQAEIATFQTDFVPILQTLINDRVISKDLLYLSLLPNKQQETLYNLLQFNDRAHIFENYVSLFNYCVSENKHWLPVLLENLEKCPFSDNILTKLYTIKLLNYGDEVNATDFEHILQQFNVEDKFINLFISEVNYLLHIKSTVFENKRLPYLQKDLLNIYYETKNIMEENWETVIRKLEQYELHLKENYKIDNYPSGKPSEIFICFTIMSDILTCLKNCKTSLTIDTITERMQNAEVRLLGIKNMQQLNELLENIYALLFIEERHIKKTGSGNVLYCTQAEIRLIVCFLRSSLDKIFTRNIIQQTMTEEEILVVRKLDKTLTDTIWRIELVQDLLEDKKDILNYMFASPESLIYLCLKNDDFGKAKQVIQIFNLNDTPLAKEILYTEQLNYLREDIMRCFKYKNEHNTTHALQLSKVMDTFCKLYKSENREVLDDSLEDKYIYYKSEIDNFVDISDIALTWTGNAEECSELWQMCDKYTVGNCTSSQFIQNIQHLYQIINEERPTSTSNILCSTHHNFDVSKYLSERDLYDNLRDTYDTFQELLRTDKPGTLNNNHPLHKTFFKFYELLKSEDKDSVKYFLKVFNYLKEFSKIFYTEKNNCFLLTTGKDVSYFEILNTNRMELFGKLIYDQNMQVYDFEQLFHRLQLDLLYHTAANCFPHITINFENKNHKGIAIRKPEKHMITYIQKRNWLLAYLINEIHRQNDDENLLHERRLKHFLQFKNLPHNDLFKSLYNDNTVITALQHKHMNSVWNYLNDNNFLQVKTHSWDFHLSSGSFETAQEISEGYLKSVNWKHGLDLIESIPQREFKSHPVGIDMVPTEFLKAIGGKMQDRLRLVCRIYDKGAVPEYFECSVIVAIPQKVDANLCENYKTISILSHTYLQKIKDEILVNILIDGNEPDYYKYVLHISEPSVSMNVVFAIFKTWPAPFCIDVLKSELTKEGLGDDGRALLEEWLKRIVICEEINFALNYRFWFEVEDLCKTQPERILSTILKTNRLPLLLDFLRFYPSTGHHLPPLITVDYFLSVFTADSIHIPDITTLLGYLSQQQRVATCLELVTQLRNLDHLQYLIGYLEKECDEDLVNDDLRNVRLSLRMLRCFNGQEQAQMWPLLHYPLHILETLIMNTKLDLLDQILNTISPSSVYIPLPDDFTENVDHLLRTYADKSLEMRVVTELSPRLLAERTEHKLMQSLDSMYGSDAVLFQLPDRVPAKDDWVPNNEIVECMCCQQTVFSMFNRRHHCRRCGRVVCFNCSLKRLQVSSYANVFVRVCLDCYQQTKQQQHHHLPEDSSDRSQLGGVATMNNASSSSYRSLLYDDRTAWLLSGTATSDAIVREEFAYEHAPSVTLCLAIMKGHSKNVEYPRFLLKYCNSMMKLMKPLSSESVHEVDQSLVVKMVKSLAIAVKLVSTAISYSAGITESERILSQADLLGLLVERGCLNLLPRSNVHGASEDPYVDASVLRRLRDILVEREQWNFALEVSTKAGLSNIGIFAAWGKSYLKAGSLQMAREKFQRCFDKTAHYESSDFYQSVDTPDNQQDSLSRMRNTSRISFMSYSSIDTLTKAPPTKNPALLTEIIQTLESITCPIDRRILADLDMKKQLSLSTTDVNMSMTINAQNVAIPDVALCIQSKLLNLQAIKDGNYSTNNQTSGLNAVLYDECVFYLNKYGSHLSLMEFYIKHNRIETALKYLLDNRLSPEMFVEVYMICLRDGAARTLQECLITLDSTLDIWKTYMRCICRHLEKQNLLNSLYQLQQFMGDYVRAAMTCIRFYKYNATSFIELAGREHYLHKAKQHLNQDLEQDQWVEVAAVRKMSRDSPDSYQEKGLTNPSLVMKVDSRNIDSYITTISNQIEVGKILANYETTGRSVTNVLAQLPTGLKNDLANPCDILPTLFGTQNERIQICVLLIVCTESIESGYSVAYEIMQEYKLKPIKVYCYAGKALASFERYEGIAQLVACLRAGGTAKGIDAAVSDMCDEMLSLSVRTLVRIEASDGQIEALIKLIADRATKISAYIECKQLKSAYLLAVRHNRIGDIRRILREAELLNKPDIKKLCQKILQSHAHTPVTKEQ